MNNIEYVKLTDENFSVNSLDDFIRYQEIKECWRLIDGEWKLVANEFIEDWDLNKRREIAASICDHLGSQRTAYGAFLNDRIVGFAVISHRLFGSEGQYSELELLQVSQPFRRMGIGKRLFGEICREASLLGAKKLYISAHSSKESQAAYRKLGCVDAIEINREIAENEPFDVQMEYVLTSENLK
ncbi:MAG: GNAT family N-acetyltransferase [Oscillospiraceae bacterium]